VFHFTKNGAVPCDKESVGVPYVYKSNIERFSRSEDKHCAGNVWFIPYKTIVSKVARGKHPATFPEELVERCIKFSGVTTGTLLDPFMGTGTSGVAGVRCGLDVIGYDISEDYCSFSKARISKEIGLDRFVAIPI
jgi:site-specific DNA-methyltransferase (adenine-specific)